MTSSSPPARPSILLVGGPASRGWRPGLEAAGLEVREVAWLEAVTAARMRRPDLKVRPRSVAARISLLALSICALVLCLLPIGYLALYG